MNYAIETTHLGKNYADVAAVQDLNLRVAEGEIYAFLGLNGAGKTTTIRMLLGMIHPTTGSARILGTQVVMSSRRPWQSVGYLVETPRAYPDLTVRENLEIARRLHPGTTPAAVGELIERLSLSPYVERKAANLSLGNAQRLGLAKALLHHPRLLLLDEPANGLDPAGIVEIRQLLLDKANREGVTVFISSHILAEISRMAMRIGIIHQGRLLQELDYDAMERNRRRRLLVRARDPRAALLALSAAGHAAALLPGGDLEITTPSALERPEEIATALVAAGSPPTRLHVEEEDLEQYFLRLVGINGDQPHE